MSSNSDLLELLFSDVIRKSKMIDSIYFTFDYTIIINSVSLELRFFNFELLSALFEKCIKFSDVYS